LIRNRFHESPKIQDGIRRYNPPGNYYFCRHPK
jgi:hypothetical protein